MTKTDQSEVIAFLGASRTHGGSPVERIETHASVVFLAGERALKLKRAVRYDYLDFSTLERRQACCEAEVRLNRRTAPALYRAVLPVTREADGRLALGGGGAPVDWVIEMARFDQDQLLDRLASRGQLDLAVMRPLAEAIARFHAGAEPRPTQDGRAGMAWVVEGNQAGFAAEGRAVLDPDDCAALTEAARAALERQGDRLDARGRNGFIRACHGDLHLRNIVLLDAVPTPFDGVEFNEQISCIDVLYDLAFLLMDLWRHGLRRHAHLVLNAYLQAGEGGEALALLPLFLACRAAVRAKTGATAAALEAPGPSRGERGALAVRYLALARRLLAPPPPAIVAVGGLSGSGKSTLAFGLGPELGPTPGALIVRTDEVRKQLCGVPFTTRLGPEGYAPSVSDRVYAIAIGRAVAAAAAGHAAIVDGVFANDAERDAVARAAAAAGVPFVGLWLDAPDAVLLARAAAREADASDADGSVIRAQLARGTGHVPWARIAASGDAELVLASARATVAREASASLDAD